MPTVRLIPSTYYLSNSSYLSVSNASNMYSNTDDDTYGTVTNSRTSTTSYYIYLRGFNFSEIPSAAVVSSFTVKLKARESGVSTSSSYVPYLAHGTTTFSGCSTTAITTTASVHTFTCNQTWETISGYGDQFGIRINCRRSNRNTTSYMYIYGAEIDVTYTVPAAVTITSTLTGNGTIDPSGATHTYEGEEYTLTITPTNKSDTVTATQDGVDITSQLVAHGSEGSAELTATDVDTYDIQSGSSYASYCIGYTAEDPYSSSSNMYASDTGYAEYSFNFSSIPSNATIEEISVNAYGHRESATIDSSHISQIAIYNGSTKISSDVDFPSTSSSLITCEATTLPTRSQLDNVKLRHTVGYYGGLVLGITFKVTYSTGSGLDHYTYTFTVGSSDSTIAVVIGGSVAEPKLYAKLNGSWLEIQTAYKKINGAWVVQTDLTSLFNTTDNFKKG